MNKSENKQKIKHCYHCGNQTLMNQVMEHKEDWGTEDFYGSTISTLYMCPICQKATYCETSWDDTLSSSENPTEEVKWPNITFESAYVPDNIRKAYEVSLKSINIDHSLCLVSLRRTLEMICKGNGAKGNNLQKMIIELSKKNVFPPTLENASNITRHLGNAAAHADNIDVDEYELKLISQFVRTIIEYIYVLPAKLSRLNRHLMNKEEDRDKEVTADALGV